MTTSIQQHFTTIFNAVTTNQTSALITPPYANHVIQVNMTGTGVISATVTVYGNINAATTGGVPILTLSPTGTTTAVAGGQITAPWPYIYVIITAITGTGATLTCLFGA